MSRRWAVVVAILLLTVVLLVDAARRDSLTFDEPSFMEAGVAVWERGDYRFAPDGGILPERLQGLAMILGGVRLQPNESAWSRSDGYEVGGDLVYRSGTPPARVIFLARLPSIVLSVLLGLLVYHIARQLLGDRSALAALALYASCPVVLANGHLATADMGAALMLLLRIEALQTPSPLRAILPRLLA